MASFGSERVDMKSQNGKITQIGSVSDVTNGGKRTIDDCSPYTATVKLCGTSDLLFHRWNCESIEEKSKAAKGSKAKKSDDIESYLYRDEKGMIAIPGEYLRQSCLHAAKFRQDPRSPRKSAMDLYKAGIVSLTQLASIGKDNFDYEHKCRVTIQRSGITRTRPAIKAGWTAEFQFGVMLPEYIHPSDLHDVLNAAGRLIGLGDFRPTYGRFSIATFEIGLID